jgi:predicted amidohydrolase YtcJ
MQRRTWSITARLAVLKADDRQGKREVDAILAVQHCLPSLCSAHSLLRFAEDRLGNRTQWAYPWASTVAMPFGSDFPVEPVEPFYGLHAAFTRQDEHSLPAAGWYPQQRLSLEATLRALFTLDGAAAVFQEDDVGMLEVGKWADYVVVDRDFMRTRHGGVGDEDRVNIRNTKVLAPVVGGRCAFNAPTSDVRCP